MTWIQTVETDSRAQNVKHAQDFLNQLRLCSWIISRALRSMHQVLNSMATLVIVCFLQAYQQVRSSATNENYDYVLLICMLCYRLALAIALSFCVVRQTFVLFFRVNWTCELANIQIETSTWNKLEKRWKGLDQISDRLNFLIGSDCFVEGRTPLVEELMVLERGWSWITEGRDISVIDEFQAVHGVPVKGSSLKWTEGDVSFLQDHAPHTAYSIDGSSPWLVASYMLMCECVVSHSWGWGWGCTHHDTMHTQSYTTLHTCHLKWIA